MPAFKVYDAENYSKFIRCHFNLSVIIMTFVFLPFELFMLVKSNRAQKFAQSPVSLDPALYQTCRKDRKKAESDTNGFIHH